jgi:hypothetical protein
VPGPGGVGAGLKAGHGLFQFDLAVGVLGEVDCGGGVVGAGSLDDDEAPGRAGFELLRQRVLLTT